MRKIFLISLLASLALAPAQAVPYAFDVSGIFDQTGNATNAPLGAAYSFHITVDDTAVSVDSDGSGSSYSYTRYLAPATITGQVGGTLVNWTGNTVFEAFDDTTYPDSFSIYMSDYGELFGPGSSTRFTSNFWSGGPTTFSGTQFSLFEMFSSPVFIGQVYLNEYFNQESLLSSSSSPANSFVSTTVPEATIASFLSSL